MCVGLHTSYPQFSNISSGTTGSVKAKIYVEPLWEWGIESFSNGPGHLTKMATMPIYGKNTLKIFFETGRPMAFKLHILHQGLVPYKVCSNDDPRLTKVNFAP